MTMQQPHNYTIPSWPNQHQPCASSPSYHDLQLQAAASSLHHRYSINRGSSYPSFLNQDQDSDDDNVETTLKPSTSQEVECNSAEAQDDTHAAAGREVMFEKQLTPSDVGKLNRLVIPKQHAEKYFPLGGGDTAEHKSLVLSFLDESGNLWRFRYSYWHSSQSYVLTKGWSRYVKEKRLDAGDVVFFERDQNDAQSQFIGCKQRRQQSESAVSGAADNHNNNNVRLEFGTAVGSARVFYTAHRYRTHHHQHQQHYLPYHPQPECLQPGRGGELVKSQRTRVGSRSNKVLRLFGVNMEMECQPEN